MHGNNEDTPFTRVFIVFTWIQARGACIVRLAIEGEMSFCDFHFSKLLNMAVLWHWTPFFKCFGRLLNNIESIQTHTHTHTHQSINLNPFHMGVIYNWLTDQSSIYSLCSTVFMCVKKLKYLRCNSTINWHLFKRVFYFCSFDTTITFCELVNV